MLWNGAGFQDCQCGKPLKGTKVPSFHIHWHQAFTCSPIIKFGHPNIWTYLFHSFSKSRFHSPIYSPIYLPGKSTKKMGVKQVDSS